jgi:hypothetical protein
MNRLSRENTKILIQADHGVGAAIDGFLIMKKVESLSLTDPIFRFRKQRQKLRIGLRHHQKPLLADAHGTVVDPQHPPYLRLLHPAAPRR